ncbi:MAG: hypothetical protein C0599_16500 [Salinivirgaceae bacterium]|nr:MAG: hypothetical protein C0599_16500 [Salinivirgaceae bacterium]
MKHNTKIRIEQVLKFTWLAAAIILLVMGFYYGDRVGWKPATKFFILSGISFLFFIRRHYFSK